jgi:hypothetical protein
MSRQMTVDWAIARFFFDRGNAGFRVKCPVSSVVFVGAGLAPARQTAMCHPPCGFALSVRGCAFWGGAKRWGEQTLGISILCGVCYHGGSLFCVQMVLGDTKSVCSVMKCRGVLHTP